MGVRVLCLLLASAVFAYADNNVPTIANDFIFTFFNAHTPNHNPSGVLLLALVSNNNNGTANVVVTSPYLSFKTIRVSVAPYSVLKIPITPESIQGEYPGSGNVTASGHIVVEDKGIRLQSDLPVAVHAHAEAYGGYSAGSFLVLPTIQLGLQYVAADSLIHPYPNMIAVVAYEDNTQITIGNQAVNINALQVASVASWGILSGIVITGNKPFGAISGSTCGWLTSDDYCNYEAVMLLPVGSWGTEFVAIPTFNTTYNYYQVVANTDHTYVSADGAGASLDAGEYARISTDASFITSNHPIQVVQIGQNVGNINNQLRTPFFLQLPSIDKMSNTNVLFQPTGFIDRSGKPLIFFIRIVTNLTGAGTIQLDGTTISALQYKRIPNSNVYYYESTISNSTHSVTTTNPGTHYSVTSYTYGENESCGFACAFDLPSTI
uniref:IgGFc-binding protein N-terminal domain-containing protein n=1 Tax=Plectus sambesii TaxID=2011161 RepID=A0A914V3L2_9BILA